MNAAMMPMTVVMTAGAADCMPTANPSMMTVAGPILAWLATPIVGAYSSEVHRSVK
jgi:hypothetical protein